MSKSIHVTVAAIFALTVGLLAAQSAFAGAGAPTQDGIAVVLTAGANNVIVVDPDRSESAAGYNFTLFALATDQVVFGDWDGDGTASLGVVRTEPNGDLLWIRDFTGNGSLIFDLFGSMGDIPVVGNWDASDVADEIGVARPDAANNAMEWILRDNNGGANTFSRSFFGADTDTPVPGNWDSDANNGDERGVTRSDNGALLWITDTGGMTPAFALFGNAGDTPIPGDYKGTGDSEFGFRSAGSNVFVLDGTSIEFVQLGSSSDPGVNPLTFGQP